MHRIFLPAGIRVSSARKTPVSEGFATVRVFLIVISSREGRKRYAHRRNQKFERSGYFLKKSITQNGREALCGKMTRAIQREKAKLIFTQFTVCFIANAAF